MSNDKEPMDISSLGMASQLASTAQSLVNAGYKVYVGSPPSELPAPTRNKELDYQEALLEIIDYDWRGGDHGRRYGACAQLAFKALFKEQHPHFDKDLGYLTTHHPQQPAKPSAWFPTPENIALLPYPLRTYIEGLQAASAVWRPVSELPEIVGKPIDMWGSFHDRCCDCTQTNDPKYFSYKMHNGLRDYFTREDITYWMYSPLIPTRIV